MMSIHTHFQLLELFLQLLNLHAVMGDLAFLDNRFLHDMLNVKVPSLGQRLTVYVCMYVCMCLYPRLIPELFLLIELLGEFQYDCPLLRYFAF